MTINKNDQDKVTTDKIPVTLVLNAVVELNKKGDIVTCHIPEGVLCLRVADSEGKALIESTDILPFAQRVTENEHAIVRHLLHVASVQAMPKGTEAEIISQHLTGQGRTSEQANLEPVIKDTGPTIGKDGPVHVLDHPDTKGDNFKIIGQCDSDHDDLN